MLALERLSPLERAAFLLHDVFGANFNELAETIGRAPGTSRQLASRARAHPNAAHPRFTIPKERGSKLATAFFEASRHGDMERLPTLFAEDVVVFSDGGGNVPAGLQQFVGIANVLEFHPKMAQQFATHMSRMLRYVSINGLPGFVSVEVGVMLQTTALQIEDGKVAAAYIVRNPDKLAHLGNVDTKTSHH